MTTLKRANLELAASIYWVAHAATAAGLIRKAHVPGDGPEDHEDNTFGLPEGKPVRRILRRYFRLQLQRMVGFVAKLGAEIPDQFPSLADYDDPMASAMTPIIGQYWDRSGRALRGRLGLDPDEWRVTDPNVRKSIKQQCLKFCSKTNATTTLSIEAAREAVRRELAEGLIGEGRSIPELTRRIQSIFQTATKSRAETIARTETSRAIHDAVEMSAEGSGVVRAKKWLLSAHSCPICVGLAEAHPEVALGAAFGTVGRDPDYSEIRNPPAHPNCRCSITFILVDQAHDGPVPAFAAKPRPEPSHVSP